MQFRYGIEEHVNSLVLHKSSYDSDISRLRRRTNAFYCIYIYSVYGQA